MATREKVREEVSRILLLLATGEIKTAEALSRLNNWLVIKVERELPQVIKRPARLIGATYPEDDKWKGDEHFEACPICGQVGYGATEPLVIE